MKEKSLYDTGFLFAALDKRDVHHSDCLKVFESEDDALLPVIVLPELAYLIKRELSLDVLIAFLKTVAEGKIELEQITGSDLERAAEILEQYADNHIDLVDAVVVAMAERLDIKRILTVDRRHFGVFKPKHCGNFVLVP